MSLLRLEALVLAALVSAPALWAALVAGSIPLDVALLRFLLAVPACAVGWALLRTLFDGYAGSAPRRRSTDAGDAASEDPS